MGNETLFQGPALVDPGRAKRDEDLPGHPGGSGEDDQGRRKEGGGSRCPHFFERASENIAWDREDCTLMFVSLVELASRCTSLKWAANGIRIRETLFGW
jgi:hypothetical protein